MKRKYCDFCLGFLLEFDVNEKEILCFPLGILPAMFWLSEPIFSFDLDI